MDKYITNLATQSYGPRLSGSLRRLFIEAGPTRTFVLWVADQLDDATQTMTTAMENQRTAASARASTAEERLPLVDAARTTLRALQLHLEAKKADPDEPWSGDPELFFPVGLRSVSNSARSLCNAITAAHTRLESDHSVPDRARWLKRLAAHNTTLAPLVDQADEAGHAHLGALSEQSVEKRNWLKTYRAAAMILQGCLVLAGREGEYTAAVPHLNAPGTRKKSERTPKAPTPTA